MKKNRCDDWTDKQWSSYWLKKLNRANDLVNRAAHIVQLFLIEYDTAECDNLGRNKYERARLFLSEWEDWLCNGNKKLEEEINSVQNK